MGEGLEMREERQLGGTRTQRPHMDELPAGGTHTRKNHAWMIHLEGMHTDHMWMSHVEGTHTQGPHVDNPCG